MKGKGRRKKWNVEESYISTLSALDAAQMFSFALWRLKRMEILRIREVAERLGLPRRAVAQQLADMLNSEDGCEKMDAKTILFTPDRFYIAFEDNQIIACAAINFVTREIRHLVVKREYRHRGVATKLVKFIIEKHLPVIAKVWVRNNNLPAQLFFRKLGFIPTPCTGLRARLWIYVNVDREFLKKLDKQIQNFRHKDLKSKKEGAR